MGDPARDGWFGQRGAADSAADGLAGPDRLALQLFAQGLSPLQIAKRSRVREETVYAALARAVEQLGVLTVREAAAEAKRRGLID